ncbi:MAG: hypothetical protein HGA96_13475 [Desulfobulbaceae bacterium]|nr:hypothetical protein [Desulfobulbaceae bacterium]
MTLLVDGRIEATAVNAFNIAAQAAVTGTITLAHANVPQGENLAVDLAVGNVGNLPLSALPVRLLLADATGVVRLTSAWTADLDIDATFSRAAELASKDLAPGNYRLWLECDQQGNTILLAEASIVIVDVTPPQLTVLAPLPGAILSGPFELAVLAEDAGSGLAAVAYQLDAGAWLPLPAKATAGSYGLTWTPVPAESGPHRLLFRATDKAGLVATSAPLAITIALCDPFADLTGTLSYQPHALAPGQEINFSYQLLNGCATDLGALTVQLWLTDARTGNLVYSPTATVNLASSGSQAGEFRLAPPGLAVGDYRAVLRVLTAGQAARDLAMITLVVRSDMGRKVEVAERSHLLVWLNSGCADDESDHDQAGENHQSGPAEDFAPEEKQQRCPRLDLLHQVLRGVGDYYHLTRERAEFEAELRNPLVTDILILGDHLPLTEPFQTELQEKVNSGAGLIASGWLPARGGEGHTPSEKALLGVSGRSKYGPAESWRLHMVDSSVSRAGELWGRTEFRSVVAAPDCRVVGWLAAGSEHQEELDAAGHDDTDEDPAVEHVAGDRPYPAIVLHEYGLGRTIYYAFDYSRALTPDSLLPLGLLLSNSRRYVHRDKAVAASFAPLEVAPLQWEVASPGEGQIFHLQAALPPGLRLYDYQGGSWHGPGSWRGTLPLAAGQSGVLAFSILAPAAAGGFAVDLAATSAPGAGGAVTRLWEKRFSFSVASDRESLFAAVRAALTSLRGSKLEGATVKWILAHLDRVRHRLILGDRDFTKNIQDLKQAIGALLSLSNLEVPAIRLHLGELLRIEESRWYFHPGDGGGDDDEHEKHRPESSRRGGDKR